VSAAAGSGTARERREVVVIGGGQAGLAVGYFLARQGRRFVILEAASEPAAAWRSRWDSLRLFTPVRYDSLPGLAFPGDPDSYPARDDVVAYLTEYARRLELPVEFSSRVRSVRASQDGGFVVEVGDRRYEAEQVVVATGAFQVPFTPAMAADLGGDVVRMHSSRYRSPSDLPAGTVLVVGGGNTGYQIAAELVRSHDVHLAIGRRQTPLPQRILGRDLFRYLEATGLMRKTVDSRLAKRLKDRETLIGSSPRAARRQGIRMRPRVSGADGATVTFADGSGLAVNAVVWATGYRLDHSLVQLPVFDDRGRLSHQRGVTDVPGLYVLGLQWQHTRGSALLGWVKDDAQYIAQRIADAARPTADAPSAAPAGSTSVSSTPNGNRTRATSVKGWRANRYTMGARPRV
jgi:putative flavoprotein involved in K+ transport